MALASTVTTLGAAPKSAQIADDLAPLAPPQPASHLPVNERRRIVMLDDEPSILRTWKAILEVYGYEAVCCEHAVDALKAIADGCDCVLTDYHMPDMTGIEVIEATRSMSQAQIILMSANDTEALHRAATAAGAACVVSKPAPINGVIEIIRKLVG